MLISRSGSSSSSGSGSTFRVSTQFVRGLILSSAMISLAAFSAAAKARERQSAEEAEPSSYSDYSFFSGVNWQIEPYVGADAAIRNMRYKDEPTHPFQEHLNTFQPFVGLRLHQYFGIEAGYQQSQKGTKQRFFNENEKPMLFGGQALSVIDNVPNPYSLDMRTTNTVRGWNVGFLGFYPIIKDKTELFGKIGYSNINLDTEYNLSIFDSNQQVVNDYGHLHDSTGMLNIGAGIKHAFSRQVGGRFVVNYDRTGRLHLDSRTKLIDKYLGMAAVGAIDPLRGSGISIRPHNSWSAGVGLYYTWK